MIVSTVKKSKAKMPVACDLRNSLQVGPFRRGAGPSPFAHSNVRIFVAETLMPSFVSSPRILMQPHLKMWFLYSGVILGVVLLMMSRGIGVVLIIVAAFLVLSGVFGVWAGIAAAFPTTEEAFFKIGSLEISGVVLVILGAVLIAAGSLLTRLVSQE